MLHKLFLVFLLSSGLIFAVFLAGQKTGFFSRADIPTEPQDIKISNISDNSFTISWITQKPTTGFIKYGMDILEGVATDDRDNGTQKPRLTHHITLKNLDPDKIYSYEIHSGTKTYDNKGKLFGQLTARVTENPPAVPEPLFGKVTKPDGSIVNEALLYLQTGEGSLLSSYIRDSGNWLITLNNARTKDLVDYLDISTTEKISVTVNNGEGKTHIQGTLGQRDIFSKIVLSGVRTTDNTSERITDLNSDGVVNIFDYIIKNIFKRSY